MSNHESQNKSRTLRREAGHRRTEVTLSKEAAQALQELHNITGGDFSNKEIICDALVCLLACYKKGLIEQL